MDPVLPAPVTPRDPDEDLPMPILFNTWKHHAGALRQRIAAIAKAGPSALEKLPEQMVVMGTELMDLYLGPLTPQEICEKVLDILRVDGSLAFEPYRQGVLAGGGYRMVTFPDDTRWVLRLGEEGGRYIHLHPARWAPQTRRVRANVLKTAVMVLAYVTVEGGDPRQVKLVNKIRTKYLGFSPVARLSGGEGLDVVLDDLIGPSVVSSP